MAKYFLESSAFVKRYKNENGSAFINGIFNGQDELFYLNLSLIEIQKIFYRLWKYPLQQDIQQNIQITEKEFKVLMSRFASDLQQTFMHRIELTEEMIKNVTSVLEVIWIRSVFDMMHISAYLMVRQEYSDIIFVCSDFRSNLVQAAKKFVPEEFVIIPEST
jgi:hypothetical protein